MQNVSDINLPEKAPTLLVVDDEVFNLEILSEFLDDAGYRVECAENGIEARRLLKKNPTKYHTILLDRMMPDMDGIELVKFIRDHPQLAFVPVIIQSAKATKEDIKQGLDAGVLYYLTKPFTKQTLLSIVKIAVLNFYSHQRLHHELTKNTENIATFPGHFECRSLLEARTLATVLASACPNSHRVVIGLCELLINAIEHGNLGIGYDLKTQLQEHDKWEDEVDHRLNLPENKNKKVEVLFSVEAAEIKFSIKDQGSGFDYQQFLDTNSKRVVNSHGRGIAIAKMLSFDELEYIEPGNEVLARIDLQRAVVSQSNNQNNGGG